MAEPPAHTQAKGPLSTRRTPSLALRLALGFGLAFASTALVVVGLQAVLAERFGHLLTRMSMQGQTQDIFDGFVLDTQQRVVGVRLPPGDAVGFDDFFANLKFRVLDASGQVVVSSEPDRRSLLPGRSISEQAGFFGVVAYEGRKFFVGVWQREVHGQPYTLQLARSDRFELLAREAVTPVVNDTVALLGTLSALIFALAGALAVRSVLRPIREAEAAARSVGGGNLSARLPENRMPSEIRPLVQAFNGVLQRLESAFQAHRADITLQLQEPDVDVQIQADAGALFVLLKNLVDNAIEFSPPGSHVLVALEITGIRVQDHGPGVLPEHRAHVFERFWRAPGQSRTGSGLGLALVHGIAVAHGWTVTCSQAAGAGAVFSVRWSA